MRHASLTTPVVALAVCVIAPALDAGLVPPTRLANRPSPSAATAVLTAVTLASVAAPAHREEPLAGAPGAANEPTIATSIEHAVASWTTRSRYATKEPSPSGVGCEGLPGGQTKKALAPSFASSSATGIRESARRTGQ
jgi:hypothetical protein